MITVSFKYIAHIIDMILRPFIFTQLFKLSFQEKEREEHRYVVEINILTVETGYITLDLEFKQCRDYYQKT